MTLSMKGWVMIVLVALLLAVALVVLLVPSFSGAAVLEWMKTSMTATPPCDACPGRD